MKRRTRWMTLILTVLLLVSGCASESKTNYERYQGTFFEYFDTIITVIGYTETEEEFRDYFDEIKELYGEYHELYDIYNDYPGVNNMKTLNDRAALEPVEVDQRIIDLLLFSKEWHEKTNGITNIALGAVLFVWSDYRNDGIDFPEEAELPPMEELVAAMQHTNIDDLIIDVENRTVFYADPLLKLDIGAIAKGYATEVISEEMRSRGFSSMIISAGGNIKALEKPLDNVRDRWGIGIQNPDSAIFSDDLSIDTVFANNIAVVTSGDYQRYYYVGEEKYHHLIDPRTLMPGDHFKAVTVVTADSAVADTLSTAFFLSNHEEGVALLDTLEEEVYVLWITRDGDVLISEGMEKYLRSHGASGAN